MRSGRRGVGPAQEGQAPLVRIGPPEAVPPEVGYGILQFAVTEKEMKMKRIMMMVLMAMMKVMEHPTTTAPRNRESQISEV